MYTTGLFTRKVKYSAFDRLFCVFKREDKKETKLFIMSSRFVVFSFAHVLLLPIVTCNSRFRFVFVRRLDDHQDRVFSVSLQAVNSMLLSLFSKAVNNVF